MARYLIVNADDFGFTPDVNAGILDAHCNGILTATTLMANGDAFEDAVRLAKQTPTLDVGCHLVLIGGLSLLPPFRPLPRSVPEMLAAVAMRKLDPYRELQAQVRRIHEAGLRPLHLDTHKHTHLFPPVLDAVARLSHEWSTPWVRRPYDSPVFAAPAGIPWSKRAVSRLLRASHGYSERELARRGCRFTDHFIGFQITGQYRTAELVRTLRELPQGVTEFMCHPGYLQDDLRRAPTRLKESRVRELEALVSPEAKATLQEEGIRLVRFQELVD